MGAQLYAMMGLSPRATRLKLPVPPHAALATLPSYHPIERPDGLIHLSIAENRLSLPLVAHALEQLPSPPQSVFSPDPSLPHPIPELAAQLSKLFSTHVSRFPTEPEGFSIYSGATTVLDVLAFALCEADDGVIATGPGYSGITRDVYAMASVHPIIAHCNDEDPVISIEALEAALASTTRRVPLVIVLSPDNPTGRLLSPQKISQLVEWAARKEVHIAFDEAYALSVHDPNATFSSVIDVLEGKLPPHVHIVWTMSKDFCLSGLRVGVLYTENEQLRKCGAVLSSASPVSLVTQWSVAQVLSQDKWLRSYLKENPLRLRRAYGQVATFLNGLNIPFCEAQAGFFVWIDMRKWIPAPTLEGELQLWKDLNAAGVVLTPGSQCYGEMFGFFRMCFAAVDEETLNLAFTRMARVLKTGAC
ncbi:1-aminocyclopropane-1-carboxylate synthase-like protein 1 [Gracilariopsis chorda]|uniref:1-aminocyclopropane-1-carboxylate synthase-like protein 1 n=1 Tax=Gracilariopsis chorda TaxID=448386 RepID=A0A2V3INQ3_9FLOR|nr:1-aminocyclopropane-1-carboxylate synthase-like protein 1 [Gracilariopsis chorda]|eukprot:PXF43704.1 1-aminocyclopropane-1-carboxylate synthase-like protein 1 [Gracilariopsis chorda]